MERKELKMVKIFCVLAWCVFFFCFVFNFLFKYN